LNLKIKRKKKCFIIYYNDKKNLHIYVVGPSEMVRPCRSC